MLGIFSNKGQTKTDPRMVLEEQHEGICAASSFAGVTMGWKQQAGSLAMPSTSQKASCTGGSSVKDYFPPHPAWTA